MSALYALICAFACFTTIPMPHIDWNQRTMRYMLAALPVVGVLIGGLYMLWHLAAQALGFGALIRGAGLALIPLLVTGGIHMDGFADVVDAQSSHASPERKRQIMKDPHMGAFASMAIAAYLIAVVGLSSELAPPLILALSCIPVASRCIGALASTLLAPSSSTGMLATMQEAANKPVVCAVASLFLAAAGAVMMTCNLLAGMVALLGAACVFVGVRHMAARDFGGMSGDLVGSCIQTTELVMLVALVFVGRLA